MNSPRSEQPQEPSQSRVALAALICIAAYFALSFCHIRDPFMDDETWEFYAAKTLLEQGEARTVTGEVNVYHPHGYYYILAAAFRALGVNEMGGRSVGMIATALCFLVLLRLIRRLAGKLEVPSVLLCGGFYLLAPIVTQGALIITADTAVHHLAVSLLLLYAVERYPFKRADFFAIAPIFAACLWIKIVTPCLVMGSIVLFLLARREWRGALAATFISCAGGILLFAGTWILYCGAIGADPAVVADYLLKTAQSRAAPVAFTTKALWLARQSVTILLWVGPATALVMLSMIACWRRWGRDFPPQTGLLLAAGCVLAAFYTFIAGASFGFPRYHFGMMPVWAVLLTLAGRRAMLAESMRFAWFAATLLAGSFWLMFVIGDPLYAVNFQLKLAMLGNSEFGAQNGSEIARRLALLALPCLAIAGYALWRRSTARFVTLAVALALGMNLSLAVLQARAGYHTGLSYGETGTEALHAYIKSRLGSDRTLVAGKDIVYHTADRGYMDDWRWTEREYLLARLADPRTQFLVMGVHHNTIEQLRAVDEDAGMRVLLAEEYVRARIGSYWIWERRASKLRPAVSAD